MTLDALFPRSFPDIVASGHRLRGLHAYALAEQEYLAAAAVAPGAGYQRTCLQDAWECHERARGRVSQLEVRWS